MSMWGKPKRTNVPMKSSRVVRLWSFKSPRTSSPNQAKNPTPLEVSTFPNKKSHSLKKITQFYTLYSDILYTIDKLYFSLVHHNKFNFWSNSHRRINFFNPTDLINSSTLRLTTLHITKKPVMCGQTGAYPLNHLSVNAYGYLSKSNTKLSK